MSERRIQLWSCGGGRQSAGIAALIAQGELPKPDHVCMTALEWERKATFRYVNDYIRPAMNPPVPQKWNSKHANRHELHGVFFDASKEPRR